MTLENIVGNIMRGIAAASIFYTAGCGTTIHTQKGEMWYDCNTNKDYPPGHPCYAEVKAYNTRVAASSSPASSSPSYFSERRESYGREPRENGHRVCPKK